MAKRKTLQERKREIAAQLGRGVNYDEMTQAERQAHMKQFGTTPAGPWSPIISYQSPDEEYIPSIQTRFLTGDFEPVDWNKINLERAELSKKMPTGSELEPKGSAYQRSADQAGIDAAWLARQKQILETKGISEETSPIQFGKELEKAYKQRLRGRAPKRHGSFFEDMFISDKFVTDEEVAPFNFARDLPTLFTVLKNAREVAIMNQEQVPVYEEEEASGGAYSGQRRYTTSTGRRAVPSKNLRAKPKKVRVGTETVYLDPHRQDEWTDFWTAWNELYVDRGRDYIRTDHGKIVKITPELLVAIIGQGTPERAEEYLRKRGALELTQHQSDYISTDYKEIGEKWDRLHPEQDEDIPRL